MLRARVGMVLPDPADGLNRPAAISGDLQRQNLPEQCKELRRAIDRLAFEKADQAVCPSTIRAEPFSSDQRRLPDGGRDPVWCARGSTGSE